MKFALDTAGLYIPDNAPEAGALSRTTHLGVGAHQDDLEIMAFHGILTCFQQEDQWFTGVMVTNGSGSPRADVYADFTDEAMVAIRRREQNKAALVGDYGAQFLLDHPSGAVKDGASTVVVEDLVRILEATRPDYIYTHNLADKHDTHVGVTLKLLQALRQAKGVKPQKVYGCEVWRDLDWMIDADKVAFDVSAHENLQAALLGIFDSQIAGGKRYDLASLGRRRANATYHASHGVDESTGAIFAMDLTPLVEDGTMDPLEYVQGFMRRFTEEITERFRKLG